MDTSRWAGVAESVNSLYALIEKDPYVLQKIDALPFAHTPLHEASINGKTEMATELMVLMPSFTRKVNASGYSPLHLAVDNGQVEIALELIKFDANLVTFRGRGGVTPLHLLVEKGDHVDLLTEFLIASPKSIADVNVNGETALHVAVLNSKYEELKVLTGWIQRMRQAGAESFESQVLNTKDRQGNTALHVAAYENKHEAIKLLLQCLALDRNIQNKDGSTSLDILRANGQYMDKATEKLIKRSGGMSKTGLSKVKTSSQFLRTPITFWEYCSITVTRYRNDISEATRNTLLVITILIIAATYQTALQPPRDKEVYGVISSLCWMFLWGFNTAAFLLALALTVLLVPQGYAWYYMLISIPLCCSYGLAVYLNAWNHDLLIPILLIIAVIFGVPCYLFFLFVKWKWSIRRKTPKPKSQMILEGLSKML